MASRIPPSVQVNYQYQYRKCNKPHCRTCREGKGHGPYWYAYWREGKRQKSLYLGKELPEGHRAPPHKEI